MFACKPNGNTGFWARQLERARQFYKAYPIASALRTQFNWFQYKLLMQIDNEDRREYYENPTIGILGSPVKSCVVLFQFSAFNIQSSIKQKSPADLGSASCGEPLSSEGRRQEICAV
ncbi:MAG: DUF1016 N-terminal domain-containing protein [Tannerella sp.]|nr:DUF1016 N-terminal domain-containing protein [Tannerella sp.]